MTVVRIAAVALAASAAVAVTAPAASADCTTDYIRAQLVASDEGYVTVNGLDVTVHGDDVVSDASAEVAQFAAYVDCVV